MKARQWFAAVLKGASLGLGMIPGVSAGTMALIVGIYGTLIDAIADLRRKFVQSIGIILPYFLGAVISAVIVMAGVEYGYGYAPFAITCLFAGFIIGTLPLLTKDIKKGEINKKTVPSLAIAAIVAAAIGILSAVSKLYWGFDLGADFAAGVWWIYPATLFAGFVAAVACLLPGISGAMILYILGLYNPIAGFYIGSSSMFHDPSKVGIGIILSLILIIGVLIGFVATGRVMKSLLGKHHAGTYAASLGFVLGSIVSMFANQALIADDTHKWIYETTPIWEWVTGIILFLGAAIGFFYLSKRWARKKED